jgi:surface polysaccharide O-acyltransferase-like enzyme
VLVVAIHAAPYAESAPHYSAYVIQGIARLAVPLFLCISGFLVGIRCPSRSKVAQYFAKFLRLHLLYSVLYWLFEPLRLGAYQPLTLEAVLLHFGAYGYAGQFYLFALLQIYFALAFLIPQRLWTSRALLVGSLALAAAAVAGLAWSYSAGADGAIAPWIRGYGESSLFLWLYPFSLGIWLGHHFGAPAPTPVLAASSILLALAAMAIAVLGVPVFGSAVYLAHCPYARWPILIGTTALAGAIPWASRTLRLAPLAALGRESFGVFVLNPLILDIWALQLGRATAISDSMLRAAVTLAIAFALSRTLRKRIPFAFA